MTVYVDTARNRLHGMIMCHMWADTDAELLRMADTIGLHRRHLQMPPEASWVHFDICQLKKALAIRAGAVLTDRYGPVEHRARLAGDQAKLDMVARVRALPRLIGAPA